MSELSSLAVAAMLYVGLVVFVVFPDRPPTRSGHRKMPEIGASEPIVRSIDLPALRARLESRQTAHQ